MVFHGLLRYGFKNVARDLAYRTFKMALDENPMTREYYDSDTGKGNGMNPFWGCSSLPTLCRWNARQATTPPH